MGHKLLPFLFLLALLTTLSSCYSIEGTWKLTDIQESRLPEAHPAKIEIRDFIFRGAKVRWSLTLSGCGLFKCMMDIEGDGLFVDVDTYYTDGQNGQNCTAELLVPEKRFQALLAKVFTFQIIANFMVFSDPTGRVLFKFQRLPNTQKPTLKGTWMATTGKKGQAPQMIQIDDVKITTCQRQAQIGYKSLPGNKLQFTLIKSGQCSNAELLVLFKNALYFVKRSSGIELYNDNDDLVASLEYLMDLETANKLREEQQKEKANAPAFPTTPNPSFPSPSPINYSINDLIGKWTISKLFTSPVTVNKMTFIIAKGSILISGDCNTYTYDYSVVGANPIRLKRQSFKQTFNTKCASQDQQLYKNGLVKLAILRVETMADRIVVKVLDQASTQLFEIQKTIEARPIAFNPLPPQFAPPQPSFQPPAVPQSIIPEGKYTILLLMRRDIPRKIVTIQNYSFILKVCNDIRVSIEVRGQSMRVRTETITANNCDLGQERQFVGYLGKVQSFVKDGEDFILKDGDEKEIITLNFVG